MFDTPAIKLKSSEYTQTWQIGKEQPTADDYANFIRSGYRGNSLIYSCVREKATSYGGLRWVLQKGEDVLEDHRILELLEAPNIEQDGDEFRQAIETYKECSGNVYIRKVRQSKDFLDRRGWPVQELRLIRPDYVEIAPGHTRADDVFVIKVGGTVKDRIPRKDMIHILETDPTNDFYGLSKIAVCMREGDLDQRMTDFERSFFMNGGVPIGILTTKTPLTQAEKSEVKSRFRKMFSGVGRWFDLLVLNAEEGKYEQLGLPQSDMEASNTRALVESRICSVFGVPAVLVGAMVGLVNAADRANYQTGLYQFWTETMIPEAKLIANGLTRELLPEFAGSAERGWRVSHDFSKIEALQKDNSAKLTAAAALVREIGSIVNVNQVLQLAGLPAVEGGDQTITKPEPFGRQPMIDAPKWRVMPERKSQTWPERHIGERMPLIDAATRSLAAYLEGLQRRVIAALGKSIKVLDIGPEEEALMFAALSDYVRNSIESGWTLASLELEIATAFDIDDPGVRRLLDDAADSVRGITETTRRSIQKVFADAQASGLTVSQIADELRTLHEFSPARAETIARTEISHAQNRAAALRWKRSGMVERVIIFDGIDFDSECAAANGAEWSLDEFDANPSAHPRCIRTATPVRVEEPTVE